MKTVAVLRGGASDEHDVSLKTGTCVLTNLSEDSFRPVDIFIDKSGAWHVRGVPMSPERALASIDVAFNALHGSYGEDGTVQRLLDRLGVPYTGSGALSSALAMNKVLTKEMLSKEGVLTARFKVLSVSPDLDKEILELFRSFPQPSVIKPAHSGSSVGLTLARSFDEFKTGVKKAFQHGSQVLVEEYIKGKEATVGVIDKLRGEESYGLPPVGIVLPQGHDLFDYEAKYSGECIEECPGSFSKTEAEELQRLARLAHRTLGLRHYSRSDFMVTPKGVYFMETNTLPGLTEASLLPKELAAVGVSLPEFLEHVLDLAVQKG